VPLKDRSGGSFRNVVCRYAKSNIGSKDSQILIMRISIVVISVLCGILGCALLMLYVKKFLNDIDTTRFHSLNPIQAVIKLSAKL